MIYEIDKCYDFPVSPDTGPADDFFTSKSKHQTASLISR